MATYLEDISGFVTFLTNKDHTLQEILNHLNLVVFNSIFGSAVSLSILNENNELVVAARSGISKEILLKLPLKYNLDDKYPNVDAIRTLNPVWINTLPDWGDKYPLMKNFPLEERFKTYLAIPIHVTGEPVAVITLFSKNILVSCLELEAFLKAIGSLLSMYLHDYRLYS